MYLQDCPVPHLQNSCEFNEFIDTVYKVKKPKYVLEIGSFYGATLWAFLKYNENLKFLASIDLSIPKSDSRYEDMVKSKMLWPSWIPKNVLFKAIEGNSTLKDTYAKIASIKFDMIFIDGDHSFEGVKSDFNIYRQFLAKDGIIVIHDSVGYDSVANFVKTLESNNAYTVKTFSDTKNKCGTAWGFSVVTIN